MFKGNTNTMRGNNDTNSPERLNRIVEGTTIVGDIRSESNIRIDGKLKGTITTKGKLVIGPKGSIEGEATCQNADIEGSMEGKIVVNELLSLKSTAKVTADVTTSKLAVEPPANITGNIGMGGVVKDMKQPTQSVSGIDHEDEQTAATA